MSSETLNKLLVIGFSDEAYSDKTGEMYVLFNPDQYTLNYKALFAKEATPGKPPGPEQFDRVAPQTFKLDLLFDGTGVANNPGAFLSAITAPTKETDITEEIDKLRDMVINFKEGHHQTGFVNLVWGTLLFRGRVHNLDINYTLFKPDGTPLRAKATLTVVEHNSEEDREAMWKVSSPDLTHLRVVEASDTLPLMCKEIYGDSKYYLEVAKANNLTNFRKLEPGTTLAFPPLDKSVGSIASSS